MENELMNKVLEDIQFLEDYTAITDLMGKNSWLRMMKSDSRRELWAEADDVCLSLNDGCFLGHAELDRYFDSLEKLDELRAQCIQEVYGLTESFRGIGSLIADGLSTPIIHIAADGKTAQGLWYALGSETDIYASGTATYHQWGWVGVDFLKENGRWKLWHILAPMDFRFMAGGMWGKEDPELPQKPGFEALAAFEPAKPGILRKNSEYYNVKRPLRPYPAPPKPYESFNDAMSYGYVKEEERV